MTPTAQVELWGREGGDGGQLPDELLHPPPHQLHRQQTAKVLSFQQLR